MKSAEEIALKYWESPHGYLDLVNLIKAERTHAIEMVKSMRERAAEVVNLNDRWGCDDIADDIMQLPLEEPK
jgi:hypothetical protein